MGEVGEVAGGGVCEEGRGRTVGSGRSSLQYARTCHQYYAPTFDGPPSIELRTSSQESPAGAKLRKKFLSAVDNVPAAAEDDDDDDDALLDEVALAEACACVRTCCRLAFQNWLAKVAWLWSCDQLVHSDAGLSHTKQ